LEHKLGNGGDARITFSTFYEKFIEGKIESDHFLIKSYKISNAIINTAPVYLDFS
jgi:hypothetical protein